jgi:4-hydroxy-tetrahydrodipicolinate synthase
MSKKLSAIVICITPFDQKGEIHELEFRRQLTRLSDAGVCIYVAGSGSSEAYTYTREERDRVLAIAVDEVKGKVPVRAMGCEPRLISEMVDFVRCAERAKVDAVQIFSLDIGHGMKPSMAEMEKYYSTVIEATSLPVYLSSHIVSGYNIPVDLIERLVRRYSSIAGVHYGGPNVVHIAELVARVGDKIEIHCAGPFNAVNTLCLGANGFMGGEGNFCPALVASVISAFASRDMNLLRESFGKLVTFASINNRYGGSASTNRALKPLMNAFGLPGGTLRLPRMPIGGAELNQMINEVLLLEISEIPPLDKDTLRH